MHDRTHTHTHSPLLFHSFVHVKKSIFMSVSEADPETKIGLRRGDDRYHHHHHYDVKDDGKVRRHRDMHGQDPSEGLLNKWQCQWQ